MNKFTQTLTLTLLLGVTLGHCENVLANEPHLMENKPIPRKENA